MRPLLRLCTLLWLPCRFSDNSFMLLPWANQTLTFTSAKAFSPEDLRSSLSVMSVADTDPPVSNVLQPPPVDSYSPNTLNWIQVNTPGIHPCCTSAEMGALPTCVTSVSRLHQSAHLRAC